MSNLKTTLISAKLMSISWFIYPIAEFCQVVVAQVLNLLRSSVVVIVSTLTIFSPTMPMLNPQI